MERPKKADLLAGAPSAPLFGPRVPTVTLVSHRELRNKHVVQRPRPPGSLDINLAVGSHYRCREGESSLTKLSAEDDLASDQGVPQLSAARHIKPEGLTDNKFVLTKRQGGSFISLLTQPGF